MREETTTRTLYKFDELSREAQQKAIKAHQERAGEFFDGEECVYDDATTIAALFGLEIDRRHWTNSYGFKGSKPTIYYSCFWSQGGGACFEGYYSYKPGALKAVREHAPQDTTLHQIVLDLQHAQARHFYKLTATCKHSGHYYHSGCMYITVDHSEDCYRNLGDSEDEITQALRGFADWIYKQLERAYDYETGEENVRDYLENSDNEYTADGEEA